MATSKLMTSSRGVARDSDLSGSSSSTRSHRPTTSPTNTNPASTSYSKTNNQTAPNYFPHQNLISGTDNLTARSHSQMTADGILRNPYVTPTSSDQITLIETPIPFPPPQIEPPNNNENCGNGGSGKTVEEVWKEIVAGRKEMKEEGEEEEEDETGSEVMTLEDFLVKAGAVVEGEEGEEEVKYPGGGGVFGFGESGVGLGLGLGGSGGSSSAFSLLDRVEGAIVGFGNEAEVVGGVRGGKRGRGAVTGLIEPLDKVAQQRQRRMIKNRESAARSRERKQAYQVELESQAVKLEEENERLLKETEEMTKERFKQLTEKVIPVVEKRKPPRALRRVHSLQW